MAKRQQPTQVLSHPNRLQNAPPSPGTVTLGKELLPPTRAAGSCLPEAGFPPPHWVGSWFGGFVPKHEAPRASEGFVPNENFH